MTAGAWSAIIAGAVAVSTAAAWITRRAWKLLRRLTQFFDDWFGEQARAGVAARPGVMERLASQDNAIADIRAETQPNGGTSLRDVVHKIAADVQGLLEWRAVMETRTTETTTTIVAAPQPQPVARKPQPPARRRA